MPTGQWKGGTVVIKGQLPPPCRCMAVITDRPAMILELPGKLTPVGISMAICTGCFQRFHPDLHSSLASLDAVTLQAEDLAMLPLQPKTREGMVKGSTVPAFAVMTESTTGFVDPDIELPPVNVRMAVVTVGVVDFQSGVGVTVRCSYRSMAPEAGHRSVVTGQGISGQLVLFKAVRGRQKPINAMAAFAGSTIRALTQLPAMLILMAVAAMFMGQRPGHVPGDMTVFTCLLSMPTCQRKAGEVMIELLPLGTLEASCCMASAAVVTKSFLVRIKMAGITITIFKPTELCVLAGGRFLLNRLPVYR